MQKATLLSSQARRRPSGALSPQEERKLLAQRDAWLKRIDPSHLFFPLFDLMPGVSFFAKNRQGELMLMSRHNRDVYTREFVDDLGSTTEKEQAASRTRNFFNALIPPDSYNVGRFEVERHSHR